MLYMIIMSIGTTLCVCTGSVVNPLFARKFDNFGPLLSEATQLHNGAWVVGLLGTLLLVQDRNYLS